MKILLTSLLLVITLAGCGTNYNKEYDIVKDGICIYIKAPYCYYSEQELSLIFTENIVSRIRQNYMPILYNNVENNSIEIYKFQDEKEIPIIEVKEIKNTKPNLYTVLIRFGDIEYKYNIILKERKISNIEKL